LSAGIDPTTPALHCSMTNFGLLIMNKGEAMTGKGKLAKAAGSFDMKSPVILKAI
jgi:hypothetical protein